MIFIIREDSIKFSISQGNYPEAKKLIRRLYRFASVPNQNVDHEKNDMSVADDYLEKIKSTMSVSSSDVTLC